MIKLIIFSILIISSAHARQLDYLKCLGRAEANIHKFKVGGAYKTINQIVISELIQLSNTIVISPQLEEKVCNNTNFFPSLTIVECLLNKKKVCFRSKTNSSQIKRGFTDKRAIRDLTQSAPNMFIKFINLLQAQLEHPNCLIQEVPEIADFYYKTRYTLEDTSMEQLISEIKDINSVFKKIQSPKVFNKCKKEKS